MESRLSLKIIPHVLLLLLVLHTGKSFSFQEKVAGSGEEIPSEDDYYTIATVPVPEGVQLEVGGLAFLPDGKLAVATRRGEVWMISNALMENRTKPYFHLFAQGMHEPLGLAYKDGALYLTQRSELTRLKDFNGDGKADEYKTLSFWPLSGNYHEFSYGPVIHSNGEMSVTLNVGFFKPNTALGASRAKWRGWMLKINEEGKMTPVATGMRSPAGMGLNKEGDIFYSENQGDWIGSGGITHVESGDFVGNPAGLQWSTLPESPVKLTPSEVKPTELPFSQVAKGLPGAKPQAVTFPHSLMGISTSGILLNTQGSKFGPFEDQLFVGDQGHSKIMRVTLEKIKGQYQGAVYPFREGFMSGVLRMEWAKDASMFVGMTSRGWASTGTASFGLQRLVWTGKVPFEIKEIKAKPDGFELEFTLPIDKSSLDETNNFSITGFSYKYHDKYGSPIIGKESCPVKGVIISSDGLKARLVAEGLREGYIHEIKAKGILSTSKLPLLHDVGYYTLNALPEGDRIQLASLDTKFNHAHHTPLPQSSGAEKIKNSPNTGVKRLVQMPKAWTTGPDKTFNIGTEPGLKFDITKIEVKRNSKISLVFNNNDDMLHNFVVVKPGKAKEVGDLAMKLGLDGAKMNFIPDSDFVLYHTSLLQPESSENIYFQAPSEPGEYPYLCSVPGHSFVMRGVLKVY